MVERRREMSWRISSHRDVVKSRGPGWAEGGEGGPSMDQKRAEHGPSA